MILDLIQKKKMGAPLSDGEIAEIVRDFTDGTIPDYQMSAFLMAVCLSGMNKRETAALTSAIASSGDTLDLSRFGDLSADKHSTGGVGDKTTLLVAPIAAAAGLKIAKMSGRGLGHTGGTVDKLEAIPGYKTTLPAEEFLAQVEKVGVAVIGQSGELAPADKKIYALRDVTATVDSIPLIVSSIMGKKIAAGAHNIVLDVKVGSGAFMKTEKQAVALSRAMVDIGRRAGRGVFACISDMDTPLGYAVGNALEVAEAAEILKTGKTCDLTEVSLTLSSLMIAATLKISLEEARKRAENILTSGEAYRKFCEWISAQGGDVSVIENPDLWQKAKYSAPVLSPCDGYIAAMNAEDIGVASLRLGAGRKTKADSVDPAAGIVLSKKTGDAVKTGDVLATLYTNDEAGLPAARDKYLAALRFSPKKPKRAKLIKKIIT